MSGDRLALVLLCVATGALTTASAALPPARAPARTPLLLAGAGAVVTGLCLVPGLRVVPPQLLAVAALVVGAVARDLRRRRARIDRAVRRDAAIEACAAMVAELRAGATPGRALRVASRDWEQLAPAADAAALGADVPAALRRVAAVPGASSVRWVASAWVVAHRSGAGLASAVQRAVSVMTDERDHERLLETELASARATARLLAALPAGVLLVGAGAGGDPVGFLLASLPGNACLVAGAGLAWGGTVWLERIADTITSS